MKSRFIFFLILVNFVSLLFPENKNETNYIKECVNNYYYKDNYKNWIMGASSVLHENGKEDGNHGHVTVAVGYTEKGIIVNDPYGNLNSGTTYSAHDIDKGDGAFEEYDKTRWFIGEKWAGYLNK